jgi:ubiquinone/menaquinone biosynthesis C-methylase UbiE/spore maturation protein CgeB
VTPSDRISKVYRGQAATPKVQQRERARIDWLVGRAHGDVLDLGCSQGIATMLCARRGLQTVGVDVDEELIAAARSDLADKPDRVRRLASFEVGDGSALRFDDDSFDTVLLGAVLEHVEDAESLLAEVARVVRPQGTVALTVAFGFDPDRPQRRYFFLASLVDLLAATLTPESIEVVDGVFRVAATPGRMSPSERRDLIVDNQPRLEEVLTDLGRELALVRDRRRRLAEAIRRMDRSSRKARWRLTTIRSSRWWRLGNRLSSVLPRALVRRPGSLPPKEPAGSWRQRPKKRRRTEHAELTAGSDRGVQVAIPPIELPDGPVARPDLTAAVILDRFSATALRYEWDQIQFGPDDWQKTLEREQPDLLFVESAWRGNDGRWHELLRGRSATKRRPLIELVGWCRERGIPTVFWNKEDPPNFGHFVYTAQLFDHVFTVDGDCIPRYAEVIGREDVQVLPFGAQPRIHNPVSVPGGRAHDVVFAGTYFPHKHPGRRRQMETILAPAREFGLHIYSRIVQTEDARFQWPEEYRPHVVGSLPYERMLAVYKAYKLFLNVNSVTESPTMCARRVFELSACSTPVLSGYSRAIGEVFGDLVPISRSPDETRAKIAELLGAAEGRERRAHEAMREVLAKHTYGRRVDDVLRAAGMAAGEQQPSVSVLLTLDNTGQVEHAIKQLCRQQWRPLQAVVAVPDGGAAAESIERGLEAGGVPNATVLADSWPSRPAALNAALDAAGGDLVAILSPESTYEEHFLTDLAHAFSYTDAAVAGKGTDEHTYTDRLHTGSLLVEGDLLRRLRFDAGSGDPEADLLRRCVDSGARLYAADRFSFLAGRRERSGAGV